MDRMASIELALKNEKTEMEFYLHEAERSRNALARAMFETLANDEKEHMTRIQGLHGKLVDQGSWPADVAIELAGTNVKSVLNNLVGDVSSAAGHDDDDLAALQRAQAFEATGAKFYADLAGVCDHPQEKTFFEFLAAIEREHHLAITNSLAYLADPEDWMMRTGRSGLDGA